MGVRVGRLELFCIFYHTCLNNLGKNKYFYLELHFDEMIQLNHYVVCQHSCMFVVLNRVVSIEDGKKLADTWKVSFLEASAKENHVSS